MLWTLVSSLNWLSTTHYVTISPPHHHFFLLSDKKKNKQFHSNNHNAKQVYSQSAVDIFQKLCQTECCQHIYKVCQESNRILCDVREHCTHNFWLRARRSISMSEQSKHCRISLQYAKRSKSRGRTTCRLTKPRASNNFLQRKILPCWSNLPTHTTELSVNFFLSPQAEGVHQGMVEKDGKCVNWEDDNFEWRKNL